MNQKHEKASDVFAKADFVFARKAGFTEAFPEIQALKVTVVETDMVHTICRTVLTETTAGEYVNCSNASCYNGGVSVGSLLREMVRARQGHGEVRAICQGYEGSPKGRQRVRACLHSFTVEADITYHD